MCLVSGYTIICFSLFPSDLFSIYPFQFSLLSHAQRLMIMLHVPYTDSDNNNNHNVMFVMCERNYQKNSFTIAYV